MWRRSAAVVTAANRSRTSVLYGLSMSDYNAMVEAQAGLGGVCREPETMLRKNGEPLPTQR